ncbi:MAG: sulfite exporter TauE/SafE family protein [Pseudomonadota bacterium]
MQLYLPIAEMSVNPLILAGMGAAVGFLSGMFGVGGGFLMTPLLIFYGIPPAVAVGTEASQIVASSVSGVLAHWRRRAVDMKMGAVLVAGGAIGSVIGVAIFRRLRELGQIDVFIALGYFLFLSVIGGLMLAESLRALRQAQKGTAPAFKRRQRGWMDALPFKLRFHRSKLYISVLPPLALGLFVGVLAAIMGVGGGFIMVPAMIYLLNMPTNVVIGTSLFQIIFVTAIVTVLHATANQTVDVLLGLLLLAGGVVGAQFGARIGVRLRSEQLRALLALLVLVVAGRLGYELIATPTELYVVGGE